MMLNNNERFTYTNLRLIGLKHKLFMIDPNMNEPNSLELINLALVVFSYICDEHIDPELEHGEAVQDMIEDKEHFIYTVKDVISMSNETNEFLNEYLEKYFNIKDKGV